MAAVPPDPPAFLPDDAARAIAEGRHDDPFAVLGPHRQGRATVVTAFDPGAERLSALTAKGAVPLHPHPAARGLFQGRVPAGPYRLRGEAQGRAWDYDDAYRFGPVLGEIDEYLIGEGTHRRLWTALGAHVMHHEGVWGTHFAVWAPNARRVSVVGRFNFWDGRRHPMRRRGSTGVWEIFIPDIGEGEPYKYEIIGADGHVLPLKADPVGFGAEHPPATASVVRDISGYGWKDGDWMEARAARNRRDAPIAIYEVHLGSWRRRWDEGGRPLSYREAATELVDYAAGMGFTHLEFLPLSEHPFDGSWGYQPVGLYAPTIRHGPPHEFRDLIDAAHARGLGVILDWVPGHFPADAHGLARFDGTHLYEHADPREGFHRDWNTLIYNYGRREVGNFLVSNALYWLEEYHADGLRVDAVASMLYRDYSRREGEWIPNVHGGRENLEAIALLRRMNETVYGAVPGIMTIAEESTSFPGVSHPVHAGGLGFGFKWNMGWMNDTLDYMRRDPVHRRYHHDQMTFGLVYAFSENFILPLSHDEVVHGKGSLLGRMPGASAGERFANLRAYLGFMWGHPGKKLLFMGGEFGQRGEWNHAGELEWGLLGDPGHAGVQRLVRDLNALYRATPALHRKDCEGDGFRWIEVGAEDISVFAWARFGEAGDPPAVVISNFTPVERTLWRCGLPRPGRWREALNTDAGIYGGRNIGNLGGVAAEPVGWHGMGQSAPVTLPPLATLILVHEP
jgi:1,4-alpha-glucan branching enzyme